MAKTTTTIRKFDIVDLIRSRKQFPLLNIPPLRVSVTIEITASGMLTKPAEVPSAKMDRLEKAARSRLEEYEDTITKESARFHKKLEDLLDAGKLDAAIEVANDVNTSINGALRSAEAAANVAVEAAKKKEAQGDKLLIEARVKTTVKIVFSGVSLATNAAKLAGTAGADVTAYFSIAKTLLSLGLEIKQQIKGQEKLRQDLIDGMQAYMDLRSTAVQQALKRYGVTSTSGLPPFPGIFKAVATRIFMAKTEITAGKDANAIARELADFTVKSIAAKFNDVTKAREMYRNHLTKMRQKIDDVSVGADKLQKGMKSAPNLKEGVKIGAECMQAKASVRKLAARLEECLAFLSANEAMMKGFGLECDDRTIVDKIKDLDKLTIASEGADVVLNLNAIHSLYTAVAALV